MPYEEDLTPRPSYTNVSERPDNLNPAYYIQYTPASDRPPRSGDGTYIEPTMSNFQVTPAQWTYSSSGTWFFEFSNVTPNSYITNVQLIQLLGDDISTPRNPGMRQSLPLPSTYGGVHFTYQLINGNLIIQVDNLPSINSDFTLAYLD